MTLSPDGKWRWNGTEWVPAEQGPPPSPRPSFLRRWGWWLALGGSVLAIGTCVAVANQSPDQGASQGAVTATEAPAAPTSRPSTPAPPAIPAVTDEQARQAVLRFQACPASQHDTLADILTLIYLAADDSAQGTSVTGREGETVTVASAYTERGQSKRATFAYRTGNGQVDGADDLGRKSLDVLRAECPS